MINLYVYPNAKKPFEHDRMDYLYNTTVFSEEGISKYCKLVEPDKADYFYMGQITCGTYQNFSKSDFNFLKGNERKHIVEIEGDWHQKEVPQWLLECLCVGNGDRLHYKSFSFFTRPCLSRLLVHLAKKTVNYDIDFPEEISAGFIGQYDPYGTRQKLYRVLSSANLRNEVYFNNSWYAQIDLKKENDKVQRYAGVMQRNILSLCPRGVGEDSSRLYETCFFGRVPVIVGSCRLLDEYKIKDKFFFRFSPDISESDTLNELQQIYNTPLKQLKHMGRLAKEYFEKNIKGYFSDPTGYYLRYLNEKNS